MTYESDELIQYISLANLIELRYVIATDSLEIFRVLSDKCEIIYEGPLDRWYEKIIADAKKSSRETLEQLCRDAREGKDSFTYNFVLGTNHYVINCKTITADSGQKIIYGTLQLNKNTNLPSESAFRRASDKDPMLDMLNKKAIISYAKNRLENVVDVPTYLIILDLDNFKMVNDTFGHMFGDEVLIAFTDIIKKAIGRHGVVGRIGGDEILIVTKDIYDKATLRPYLREIRTNMEMMYKGKLNGISLTCSIGAAAYPTHADSFRETMELADKMLYLAKEKGRNRYVIFTPEMHSEYVKNANNGVPNENRQVAEYDRIGIMHYMLKDYLTCQTCTDEYIFTQIGEGFRLNEILCNYNHGNVGYRWTSDSEKLREEDMNLLRPDDPFFEKTDANGLIILDGVFGLEETYPEFYEKLTARKIESVLFYRLMKNGKPDGFIMFARRHQRQKWSEYEVMSLSIAAKIFELSIADSR
ncbi:MAG: GGDEF domain-containing protein [Lachnospiraceae bacterium]